MVLWGSLFTSESSDGRIYGAANVLPFLIEPIDPSLLATSRHGMRMVVQCDSFGED